MSELADKPKRLRTGGRAKGTSNKITRDMRESILQAFHKVGGRDWVVRLAQRRPDVAAMLFARIIPQETRVSLLASYQAMPIPVEARDPIPQIAAETRGDVLDAVFTAIDAPMPAPVPASTRAPAGDDWLDS